MKFFNHCKIVHSSFLHQRSHFIRYRFTQKEFDPFKEYLFLFEFSESCILSTSGLLRIPCFQTAVLETLDWFGQNALQV